MADVKTIEKDLNKQLEATTGVVNGTNVLINTTSQTTDTVIVEVRDYYLGPFDWLEENLKNIATIIQSKVDGATDKANVKIDTTEIVNTMPDTFPAFIKAKLKPMIDTIVSKITAQISSSTSGASGAADTAADTVVFGTYNSTLKPIKDTIDSIINTIKETLAGVFDTASSTVNGVSKVLTQDTPNIVSGLGQNVLQSKIMSLPAPVGGIVGDAFAKLQELGGGLFPNLQFMDLIKAALASGVTALVTGISGILSGIASTLSSITGDSAASEIIQKAIDEIQKASEQFQTNSVDSLTRTVNTNTNAIELLYALSAVLNYNNSNFTKLNNAKVSLDSLNKINSVVETIHREFETKTTATVKSWIKLIKHIHPQVDKNLEDLLYFKPISNDIASRTLGYYVDTQSLDLADWKTKLPTPVRLNLQHKLDPNDLNNINSSYHELNKVMCLNLSTEFTEERATRPNITGLNAHDYHIAGDSSYSSHIRNPIVILGVIGNLLSIFLGSIRLINYLVPISNYGKAISGSIDINIKDNVYSVNVKGAPYQKAVKAVDKSVLKPK